VKDEGRLGMGNFQELKVWQRAKDLAVHIYKLTGTWTFAKDYGLKDKIRRAAVSVASNIAEGDELYTDKQEKNIFISRRDPLLKY
jgi:four helix bundle protein